MMRQDIPLSSPRTKIIGLCALTAFLVYSTGLTVPPQADADHPSDFCQLEVLPADLPLGDPPTLVTTARARDAPAFVVRLVSTAAHLSRGPPA